jgi:hypothetical protein
VFIQKHGHQTKIDFNSEALLLKTYGADIPNPVGDEVNGEVDSVSVDILKKFQPVVLEDDIY